MVHRVQPSMLLASFALALAGCGGGGDGGPPAKLSGAFLDSLQRSCQKSFDCESSYVAAMHGDEPFADFVGGSTVDACVNTVKTLVLTFNGQDYLTKLDASVAADRIKYNANDFDTCLAAVEASSCDEFFEQNGAIFNPPATCATFEVGQVPTAGACTLTEDCAAADNSCDEAAHTCG